MNRSILLGRLTKNPEIRYSPSQNLKIAMFTLAVDRKYVKQGEERQTDFISIIAYSKLADFAEKYLKSGMKICIGGRIQTRKWEDKEGKTRYVTEVVAEEIDFAESIRKEQQNQNINQENSTTNTEADGTDELGFSAEDLPF